MHVIATDEAGYGPKLGPLVVVGTSWEVKDQQPPVSDPNDLTQRFDALTTAVTFGKIRTKVDDSKAVFKPGQGNDKLSTIVRASMKWCGHSFERRGELLRLVAGQDVEPIQSIDWYQGDSDPLDPLDCCDVDRAIEVWKSGGVELAGVAARVITAGRFNHFVDQGWNKADLLSQTTLGIVRDELERVDDDQVEVFCDRHGGRRYYLSVLQHIFPDAMIEAIEETKSISRYQINNNSQTIRIAFTVKGDRFPPVAMSSIHAKFIREWMMEAFNRYFAQQYICEGDLNPTAGYPVDADRFLKQIESTVQKLGIRSKDLVRSR